MISKNEKNKIRPIDDEVAADERKADLRCATSRKVEHGENPFQIGARQWGERIDATRLVGGEEMFNTATGELVPVQRVARTEVDKAPFVKVFACAIPRITRLAPPAVALLCHLLNELSRHKEHELVHLSPRAVADFLHRVDGSQLSRSSYYRARAALIDAEIIAHSTRVGQFWINANLFWNGSRIDHERRRRALRTREALDAATPNTATDGS